MRTCRLCPKPVSGTFIVCRDCWPKWTHWKNGKRELRNAGHRGAAQRLTEQGSRAADRDRLAWLRWHGFVTLAEQEPQRRPCQHRLF